MANDNQFIQEDVLFSKNTQKETPANNAVEALDLEDFNEDIGAEVLFSSPSYSAGGVIEELSIEEEPLLEELLPENDDVVEESLFIGERAESLAEEVSPIEEFTLEELLPEDDEPATIVDEEVLFSEKEEPITISEEVESAPTIVSDELTALSEDAGELNVTLPEKPKYVEKNFAQKFLEADELILKRYDELKNYILRYKGVKSRVSNDFDSFNMGRTQLFKLGFSTQSLKLYLNLDYNTVESRLKCKDVSHKKAYAQVPVFLRIKSPRAMRNAKYLIGQVVERFNLKENPKATTVDSIEILKQRAKTYN